LEKNGLKLKRWIQKQKAIKTKQMIKEGNKNNLRSKCLSKLSRRPSR